MINEKITGFKKLYEARFFYSSIRRKRLPVLSTIDL